MKFTVTSHFQNKTPAFKGLIERSGEAGSHEDQYDAGELISIGRDDNGNEMTPDQIKKKPGSPPVVLIGHLNASGRLLDPLTQWEQCKEVLILAANAVKTEVDALLTSRRFMDKEFQAEDIAKIGTRIKELNDKRDALLKTAKLDKFPQPLSKAA